MRCSGWRTSSGRARRATRRTTRSPTESSARALQLAPDDMLATSGLGSLALVASPVRRRARRYGRRAQKLAPYTTRNYGVLGDALLELGRYDEAFKAFDRMVALKPNLAGYARIAYARELLGRPREALEAMELALDASGNVPEPTAWTLVEIGKLHFSLGELGPAAQSFRSALAIVPGLCHGTRRRSRRSRPRAVIRRARSRSRAQAADSVPLPQFVGTLADLYRSRGEQARAREQSRSSARSSACWPPTASTPTSSSRSSGSTTGSGSVRRSRSRAPRVPTRPSIYGDDVLAWALARNGRCGEALAYSQRSLRLGTKDASLYFHRGMIERCLGHQEAAQRWFARAVDTNPHFSLVWAAPPGGLPREASRSPARGARGGRGAGVRARAPARQLHRQPAHDDRAVRRPDLRPLRARRGGDPDAAARRPPRAPRASRARRRGTSS